MKNIIYLFAAMAFAGLSACQSEDAPDNIGYLNDPSAIRVTATIGAPYSRANTTEGGNEFQSYDCIHVKNTSPKAIAGKDEAVYSFASGKFAPQGEKYMVWGDGENTFEAYYPCREGISASYTSFTLPLDQSKNAVNQEGHIGYADWMTAEATTTKTADGSINLTFSHRLAKVTVKIKSYNNQYNGNLPEVSGPIFHMPGIERDNAVTVNADDIVKGYMLSDNSEAKLHSFMVILPAGKYTAASTIMELTVGGQTLKVNAPAYLASEGIVAGNAYTLNLTVGKNSMTVSGITVAEWTDGWEETGTAPEETAKVEGHTVTTAYPGQLTANVLDKATSSGLEMTIKGSDLNADDFNILSAWLREKFYEDNTRLYSITLEDATELPENALYSVDNSYVVALASFKAPKVSKMHQNAFKYVKIGEIWLTKAGTMNVHEGWFEAINSADENIPTIYLNADKRIDGAGSPTVSTWTLYNITYNGWVAYGTTSKDYWRFVDEAGNITDWDGNPITN